MPRLLLAFLALIATATSGMAANPLPVEGKLPSLSGASWLNSPALTPASLRGKVVLVDFWTYSCINCLRALPYVNAWYEKYKDHGLVVIGVHAPEFAFEKDVRNVRRAIDKFKIHYPVALDNDSAIWNAFHNEYWPAHYFIDAQGLIRGHHFGEGEYDKSELTIRTLLAVAGFKDLPPKGAGQPEAAGVHAAADKAHVRSPETYIGYSRAANFSSPAGFAKDRLKTYAGPAALELNQWALVGPWVVAKEQATLKSAPGRIVFRFYARDLHLVLGSGANGKPVRFRVRLDGAAPGEHHGMDIDSQGNGTIRDHRLYQLIRQSKDVRERGFSIEFLDGGAQAFAFTFG
jgi:thiol-disulfide isomerase/thioredoxin